VLRHEAAHAASRVDRRPAPDDRAGAEHAVAADLGEIAEHSAELAQVCRDAPVVGLDRDHRLVAFDVRRDRARAHVRAMAQHRVADVVEVRHLRAVEQDRVFDLDGVADDAFLADDGLAANERAVADLGAVVDDRRPRDQGGRGDGRVPGDPHVAVDALVLVLTKRLAQRLDVVADLGQHFPRIALALEDARGDALSQIEKPVGPKKLSHVSSSFPKNTSY